MPIYEYRCAACSHQQEFLQKVSDAPLTVCTKCGAQSFSKMVTAAGFHLKGSGWYATDFKNSGSKPAAKPADSKSSDSKSSDSASSSSSPSSTSSGDSGGSEKKAAPSSGAGGSPAC